MFENVSCRLRDKLVEDEPGQHTYIQACRDCHREYGPEFVVPHWSSGLKGEPRPRVVPGLCSQRTVALSAPNFGGVAPCAA
jgi:hypothetical protein